MDNVPLQYRFYHTCGHIGLGSMLYTTPSQAQPSDSSIIPRTIPISLSFNCPFCSAPQLQVNGEGVLAILGSSPVSPFPNDWHIIRACALEDVKPEEWSLAHLPGGIHRHMAWIPEPCGEVGAIRGVEGMMRRGLVEEEVTTVVSCSWRHRRGDPFRSRFAGMVSQMNAALLPGEHVVN
ncbi:uncharacterized protein LY89DRAFT_728444 [Mollisia scopiformis]|uniref:Uncharacterized protein n=1 Tax=Mollisia scopiformis TaxID=149040 RepID=A0A194XPV1_MOLSC|nr:uncharacterized protein LY89DRAFT_728444 [Mollisia scopiformis]KUJ22285.1 hypothetical protein LY89DRAFT_728444 [Mollisia scopiformis]